MVKLTCSSASRRGSIRPRDLKEGGGAVEVEASSADGMARWSVRSKQMIWGPGKDRNFGFRVYVQKRDAVSA